MKRFIFTLALALLSTNVFAQVANPAVFSRITLGDDSTLVNNVRLIHGASDPHGMLIIGLGDGSATGDLGVRRLSVSGDRTFAVNDGAYFSMSPTYTGGAPGIFFAGSSTTVFFTPTANITTPLVGVYGEMSPFGDTHNYSNDVSGSYGGTYPRTSGTIQEMVGVIGDAEFAGTGTATNTFSFKAYCCAFDDGGAHGAITYAGFLHGAPVFKGTGPSPTNYRGIWLEAPGFASGTDNYQMRLDATTGSNFVVSAADGRVTATSVQQNPNGVSKPTCNSGNRGTFWQVFSGAGVKDTVEVCAKDAGDAYAWRTIY
jgi:hypothetical protein